MSQREAKLYPRQSKAVVAYWFFFGFSERRYPLSYATLWGCVYELYAWYVVESYG